ncbi:hypothetical protein H5410_027251 [Solanum commersonii]|uniref:Uncharacterized protein n=1 Tax=Solanum commersonii TaxID=4109 RepID=A0A9J5Z1G5_SOLCO|nr:hypothetical protein H5410_027251 [Solanum commersonii]
MGAIVQSGEGNNNDNCMDLIPIIATKTSLVKSQSFRWLQQLATIGHDDQQCYVIHPELYPTKIERESKSIDQVKERTIEDTREGKHEELAKVLKDRRNGRE